MRAVVAALRRYARVDANVLITGETGTGKDLAARTLHQLGRRRGHPFIVIDCPGLAASLLEAELFGHERGAFTDATTARPSRFELAGEGTVYLDRVDELSLDAQAKLLRLVEQKQVERLGSTVAVPIRARVVASAADGIEAAVRDGRFRMDLYHRLRVLPIRIPPLRQRRGDVPVLARRLMTELTNAAGQRGALAISRDAMAILTAYDWPGNVRELRHVLERAVTASDANVIEAGDLADVAPSPERLAAGQTSERPTLDDLERRYVAFVLQETKGNQSRAASVLGISRKALWEKRKRYGLE
jgi:two-component system response regulator HydG